MKKSAIVLLILAAVIALPLSAAGSNYIGVTGSYPLVFSSQSIEAFGSTSTTKTIYEAMNFGVEGRLMLNREVGLAGYCEYSKPYQEKWDTTTKIGSTTYNHSGTTSLDNDNMSGLAGFAGLTFPVSGQKNTFITAGIHVNQGITTVRDKDGKVTSKSTTTNLGAGVSFRFALDANPLYVAYSADVFYDFMDPDNSDSEVSKLVINPIRLSIGLKF